jgi:hypothetical protein
MQTTTITEETKKPERFALCVLYIGGMFGYRRVECGGARTRHLSCDPAWDREFHKALTESGARVLYDGRDGGRQ